MAFLASSFVVFVVQEGTNGAKHVQFVSGVDPISYWTASWLWDMVNFTLPCIGVVILFACFNVPAYTEGYRLGIVFHFDVLWFSHHPVYVSLLVSLQNGVESFHLIDVVKYCNWSCRLACCVHHSES
ncbi:phospholipid-transporting ATPase ABCA1-like [Xenia sp. Carnegie-2017]|uniref:phospholipid-transporting ATPase ABCA1-like n=1 Tax=Xenia sp. Carnegie-2017 TaxID=2897299 RepID=UPI001F04F1CA|nr:phospholipid-transporting ATPase ABCA1-like [Xenia sp. Carnegie-2017]